MITTIYKCDRCGHEQADTWSSPRNFYHLSIGIAFGTEPADGIQHRPQAALWCDQCMAQLGALPDHCYDDRRPRPDPMPSFEDRFREILREVLAAGEPR